MKTKAPALIGLLAGAALTLPADPIPVRHIEGTLHGFLILHTTDGKQLASGELIQTVQGATVVCELVFHFKDGSLDDETAAFSQTNDFRLLRDHHVQKGPSFPHPIDILIDASAGKITLHSAENGKDKVETKSMDLPADLANGILPDLMKNFPPHAAAVKVSYLAMTPTLRLVKFAISPEGEETFRVAGTPYKATRYDLKVEVGGITGAFAKLAGKIPEDIHLWILGGKAPAFVRMQGQFYDGGPVWIVDLASPVWR